MAAFFSWLAGLPPLAQIPVILAAFLLVIGAVLFFVEVAPRTGRGYTITRLAVAILVPALLVLVLGLRSDAMAGVVVASMLLGGVLFWLDYRSRRGAGYLLQLFAFLAPAIGLLLVGMVYPIIRTAIAAFLSNDGSSFVGLKNFVWVFSPGAQGGLVAVINSIVWTLIAPIMSTSIGLAYSVFVDRARGQKVLKMLIFMPVAISLVGASIIWKFFYAYQQGDQIGLLNQIMVWLGREPVSWLQSSPLNTLLLIVILIWTQTGFAMVILSAAIRNVPTEQLEAAELDGSNGWQKFWNVTVPSIRSTIIVVWITMSIGALKVYDIIATTTGGQNNTTVLSYDMVQQFGILPPQSGHSAALALLIFVLVAPFIVYNAHNLKKQRDFG